MHQLRMASLLNDVPVLHDQDHIRFPYGGKPVCHNKARVSFHQSSESLLDLHFRSGINGRCRLIQNQHGRMTEHDSCNTQKLLLSL